MSIIKYNNPELATWSPFDRLSSLRDLLDSAFQLAGQGQGMDMGWAPALDVYEDEDKVTVNLEAAGMKSEDFDLSLQDGALTISGERKVESEKREGESFRSERVFGAFRRTVNLPSPVDASKVDASYKDGVLTVVLPKAEEAKPKKIKVSLK
jgi:HSP20 family protein